MASMLMDCPQCHAMIAKGTICPECRWSEKSEDEEHVDQDHRLEFARREDIHNRNYLIFMVLKIATGLVAMFTGFMWFRFIYLGNIAALFWIVLLTLLTAGLGFLLTCAKKFFPTDLNCPGCDFQVDKLGIATSDCPSCGIPLK